MAFEVVAPEDLDWLTLEGESKYTPSTTIPRKQKFRFRFKTYTEFDKVRSAQIKFNHTGKPITRAGEIQKELLKKIVTITQEKAPLIIPSRLRAVLLLTGIMWRQKNVPTIIVMVISIKIVLRYV